ncbi:radical SAM protein [bacterium]|nr:radical SAM protein [bacterium]MBU0899996.1 radical SAM protein [bacterium]MBU1153462.1 radical SAM protein [bacterium]MBU1782821.1 radical SAM protein [bacterium]MBU2599335.1 radical SAM protein [bacterium]
MEIVLLEPPKLLSQYKFQEVTNAPLSACLITPYLSSLLKDHGFKVKIVDARDKSIEEAIILIQDESPALLGVHLVYQWEETAEIFKMLKEIKNKFSPFINLYGFYPTFAYQELLIENPFSIYLDTITIGEPEHTFLELAKLVIYKKPLGELFKIKGLAFVKDQKVVRNHDRPLIMDLDSLPFPDRTSLKDNSIKYILGSRGCYHQCSFCYISSFYKGSLWRPRSVKNIISEISKLVAQGNNYFYFADANFFGKDLKEKKQRGLKLAFLLKKLRKEIKFGLECRTSDVHQEVFKALKEAGLREVFLGVENASLSTLNRFNKQDSNGQNKKALKIIQDLGINLFLGFIMFDLETTTSDLKKNLSFLQELNLLKKPSVTAHLLSHRESVFQGTLSYQRLLAKNLLRFSKFSRYEGFYTFSDYRIGIIYQVVERFCLTVLNALKGEDLNCSLETTQEHKFKEINDLLVLSFQETISYFEDDKNCFKEKVSEFQEKILAMFS